MGNSSKVSLFVRTGFIGVLLLLGNGCQNVYTSSALVQPNPGLTLNRKAAAYVAVPADGVDDHGTYQGSGLKVTAAIQVAFAQKFQTVGVGNAYESAETALSTARSKGAAYLIYPTIIQWEDNPTEWTGEPDRIQIKLELFDVASGGTLHSTMFGGKSKWMTFGNVPEEMLPEPLAKYANSFNYRDN